MNPEKMMDERYEVDVSQRTLGGTMGPFHIKS